MAYDASPDQQPMKYHCCDTPRGMCYYVIDDLTSNQQKHLNALKIKAAKDNKQYLQQHPEIKACVALLTRYIFRLRPKTNIYECIARFFARAKLDIEEEVSNYIMSRERAIEGDSAVGLFAKTSSATSISSSVFEMSNICSLFDDRSGFLSPYSESMQNLALSDTLVSPSGTVITSISQVTKQGIYSPADVARLRTAGLQLMMEDIINRDIIGRLRAQKSFHHSNLIQKVSFCPNVLVTPGRSRTALNVDDPDYSEADFKENDTDIHLLFSSFDDAPREQQMESSAVNVLRDETWDDPE